MIYEIMMRRRLAAGVVALLATLHTPAMSANYKIDNSGKTIHNPAATMYNPATNIKNPASNVYDPASKLDNPNPLSPVTQPVPRPEFHPPAATGRTVTVPAEQRKERTLPQDRRTIAPKSYYYKTVGMYLNASKKAFARDDYREIISLTEDALSRINAGSLRASKKTKQKLVAYRKFGYGLLEKSGE